MSDGHNVHLVDPVPGHVEQAPNNLGGHPGFSAGVGDARTLRQPDASFDAVLLLGPLYHLTERSDRMQTWSETRRVAKIGGLCFAVGISRFAELSAGLFGGLVFDEAFRALWAQTLEYGQYRNPGGGEYFTTAFDHHPDSSSRVLKNLCLVFAFVGGIGENGGHAWNS